MLEVFYNFSVISGTYRSNLPRTWYSGVHLFFGDNINAFENHVQMEKRKSRNCLSLGAEGRLDFVWPKKKTPWQCLGHFAKSNIVSVE